MSIYRVLLHLYPRAFRERFEAEMLAFFAETAAAAPRTLRGRLALWRAALADLLPSAARERWPGERSLSMAPMASDVRQAFRVIRRAPLVTVFVVLLMAISIGSTTAVFSVVHAVLMKPFPFARPDRLVMVWERRSPENPRNNVGAHEYPEWKARSRSFTGLAAITFDREFNLTGAGDPLKLVSVRVTSDFFRVMGVAPQAGRAFTADEDEQGHGQVTVISDSLWRSRFGGNPSIVGRPIELNGEPDTIVGVMPAGFEFPSGVGGAPPDAWMPIAEPIQRYRGRHYLAVVGRLRDGVTIAQAQSEMDGIADGIARELPQFSRGHGVNVLPLHGEIVQGVRRALLVLFAAVALVLAIGCCNVVHLLLARAAGRQQEIAVRLALGAGRLRVARQLLAEGAVFALFGGAGGVLLASWLVALARASASAEVPRLQDARLDGAVLAFTLGVSLLTALVFGLVPLAQVARVNVADWLKHGLKGVARPGRHALRRALIVAEVALTVVVATGAGLLLRSFNRLLHVDPGFRTEGILAIDLALSPTRYASPMSQRTFFDAATGRLAALPGVNAVAATNMVPHGGGVSGIAVGIEGRPPAPPGEEPSAGYRVVSADYFKVLGIPVLSGRAFTPQDARLAVPLVRWFPQQPLPPDFDRPQPAPVALINQSMARRYWPNVDPIARRFTVLFSPPITIVGVVQDTRDHALADEAEPEFYLSDAQEPQSSMTLLVRAPDALGALPLAVRSVIWDIDRDLPVDKMRTMPEIVDANIALYRRIITLVGAFAAMALLLMALGVYAVVSYTTAQRTYEIGVRLALGAQRRDVRRLVVFQGTGLTLTGIAIGIGGAYALARFASSLLYEVTPADPITYASLAAVVLCVTIAATWGPARRAQRVDPLTVLRTE